MEIMAARATESFRLGSRSRAPAGCSVRQSFRLCSLRRLLWEPRWGAFTSQNYRGNSYGRSFNTAQCSPSGSNYERGGAKMDDIGV